MKKILFYIFIVLLTLPVLQKEIRIFEFSGLNGSVKPAKNVDFSFDKWVSSEYQSAKETYIKENIGFRAPFVKAYNQILYSLFSMAHNPGGVVGKDNYLYLESYIFNQTGENYVGYKKVKTITRRLKYLQDYFKQHHVNLLTVIVPSKASFYPEFIPEHYRQFPINNYRAYLNRFDSLGIQYVDLNACLLGEKETAKYPLFSKNGLHWTDYGMALGMDSLIKKLEEIRQIDMPEFDWEKPVQLSPMTFPTDFDAENLMNLYGEMPRDSMPYLNYIFHSDSSKTRPKTVVISDSYYWRVYQAKIPHHVFDWGGFWYYFNTARYEDKNGKEKVVPVKKIDLKEKLLEQDIIILFSSQATMHLFPYGFVKKVYPLFMPKDMESLTDYYREEILDNKDWKNKIEEKARKNNLTFDEQLTKDAQWMAKRYHKKNRK